MKDIILKKGDIVTLKNGVNIFVSLSDGEPMKLYLDRSEKWCYDVVEIKRVKEYEILYKKPQEILDKEEKEYLSAVIRPFKNKITSISKKESQFESGREIIVIYINMAGSCLPSFRKNTVYKGMELDKDYTLEELGL